MVSQDPDNDVALPYYSGAMDMVGVLYCSRNGHVVFCMVLGTGTWWGYSTVLGTDMWYSVWFWGQGHGGGTVLFTVRTLLYITCDNGLVYHIYSVPY
jgi:hypothetical protein